MLRGTEVCARRTTRTDERTLKRRGTRGRVTRREEKEKRGGGGRERGRLVNGEGGGVLAGAETVHYDRDRAWHG